MFSPIYRYHCLVSRWSQLVSFSKMIGMGCCFLLWLAVIPVQAQQVVSGTLRGTVVDESSALVNGATVRLTNQGTGQVRETQTSGDGFYTFPSVPVGTYALRVIASGFKPSEAANVNVTIGAVSTIDFKLVVGDTGDVVVVDAADSVPLIETTRAGESTL
ncbi:MAG TPA: carboxypeptidase-like regulatory domain-containing protein, partial [Acidobacteriota bacterium]|nr:carboxypeptidase-like regulatory domain-containing protein [Acidobacteriota bacterium]